MLALPFGRTRPPASRIGEIAQTDHETERHDDQIQRLLLRHEHGQQHERADDRQRVQRGVRRGPQPARIGSGRERCEAMLDRRDQQHEDVERQDHGGAVLSRDRKQRVWRDRRIGHASRGPHEGWREQLNDGEKPAGRGGRVDELRESTARRPVEAAALAGERRHPEHGRRAEGAREMNDENRARPASHGASAARARQLRQ